MFAWSAVIPLLESCGLFSLADIYQARFVAGLALRAGCPEDAPAMRHICMLTALVSRAVRDGHVCVDLAAAETRTMLAALGADGVAAETMDAVHVAAPGIVGQPGEDAPLIISGTRMYLWRMFRDEQMLAGALLRLAARPMDAVDATSVTGIAPRDPDGGINWQYVACCAALRHGLCVITGGPGTGKTTTVAAVLRALRHAHGPDMRIALAAPTGKAASRLSESLRRAAASPHGGIAVEALAVQAQTVHRLLGWRPGGAWRYHAGNPLPVDVLIVDEVSMLDLELGTRVLDALAPHARLVLLGDRHQLASVEAGAILASICGPGPVNRFSASFSSWCAAQTGVAVPEAATVAPLKDRVVELQRSYRFDPGSGIAALGMAVRDGQAEQVMQVLRAEHADVRVVECATEQDLRIALTNVLIPAWGQLAREREPEAAFALFDALRLLSPVRQGPRGSENLNQLARDIVAGGGGRGAPLWYPGRPVMVLENDYDVGLYNGDVGLTLPTPTGLRVFFAGSDGGYQSFTPARLPRHETCYAMTVHKSQGSEFGHAMLVVSEESGAVLGRELLYTALTRAKRHFTLLGRVEQAVEAVRRPVRRDTGLAELLWSRESR